MEIKVNFEQDAADGFQVFFYSRNSCLVQIQKRSTTERRLK